MPAANPALGYSAFLGAGLETTYGTAVTRTHFLRVIDFSWKTTPDRRAVPVFRGGAATSANIQSMITYAQTTEFTFTVPFAYDDASMFLMRHIFGAAPTDAGAGPYTHTYILGVPSGWPAGLTLEFARGRTGTTVESDVLEGCVISKAEWKVEAGGQMTLTCSGFAETAAARGTAGTPTFSSSGDPVMGWHGSNVTWGDLDGHVRSFSHSIDWGLARRPSVGSLYTMRPYPSGSDKNFPLILTTIEREYDDDGAPVYADWLDGGAGGDSVCTFTNSPRIAEFTGHNAYPIDLSEPVTSAGINTQTLTLRHADDGTDYGSKIILTNAVALYTTN